MWDRSNVTVQCHITEVSQHSILRTGLMSPCSNVILLKSASRQLNSQTAWSQFHTTYTVYQQKPHTSTGILVDTFCEQEQQNKICTSGFSTVQLHRWSASPFHASVSLLSWTLRLFYKCRGVVSAATKLCGLWFCPSLSVENILEECVAALKLSGFCSYLACRPIANYSPCRLCHLRLLFRCEVKTCSAVRLWRLPGFAVVSWLLYCLVGRLHCTFSISPLTPLSPSWDDTRTPLSALGR